MCVSGSSLSLMLVAMVTTLVGRKKFPKISLSSTLCVTCKWKKPREQDGRQQTGTTGLAHGPDSEPLLLDHGLVLNPFDDTDVNT